MEYSYMNHANVYTHQMHIHKESQHVKFVSRTENLLATETKTNVESICSDKHNIKRSSTKIHDFNLYMTTQNCLSIHTCNCNSIMINIFLKQIQYMNKPNLKSTQIIEQKRWSYRKEIVHKFNKKISHIKIGSIDQFLTY